MRIIISPAKKMNMDTDTFPISGLPELLSETKKLMKYIKKQDFNRLKQIWKCNDALVSLNQERFTHMDLETNLTPAILSYEGLQYQYMAPKVMEETALEYLQEHLRILSGFYGVLKPFDGVTPYRLEMQARLGGEEMDSLYAFWKDRLAKSIYLEDPLILNLASKEYSKAVVPYLPKDATVVTVVFGEEKQGKIIEKGTMAKMARGEMVRFLAEMKGDTLEAVCSFDRLGYHFCESLSEENKLIFLKDPIKNGEEY